MNKKRKGKLFHCFLRFLNTNAAAAAAMITTATTIAMYVDVGGLLDGGSAGELGDGRGELV